MSGLPGNGRPRLRASAGEGDAHGILYATGTCTYTCSDTNTNTNTNTFYGTGTGTHTRIGRLVPDVEHFVDTVGTEALLTRRRGRDHQLAAQLDLGEGHVVLSVRSAERHHLRHLSLPSPTLRRPFGAPAS
ncbi:hypothetical protein [Streptomyces cyaneofuscatus]|uniref:hypothetical protein n=1 Tax=Streptomyces cyaneofuscatus TaxID=66883 RepID=UPI0034219A90